MRYVSTRGAAPVLDFEAVTLTGLASDGGLYLPESWPAMSSGDIAALTGLSYVETAVRVMLPFVGDALTEDELRALCAEAYGGFSHAAVTPLKQLDARHWLLELFHGPTLAFKDVALQLVGLLFERFLSKRSDHLTVIGATSGDTGSAAIHALAGRDKVDIFMLHPQGRVSEVQRRQMTTVMAPNVHNIAIDGNFDDAQALVKAMFNDPGFASRFSLSAVNSINWARLMAQVVYYFYAAVRLGAPGQPVAFSVPTGNFGDVFAGYVAAKMGLPIARLIVATNVNDILHRALTRGDYSVGAVSPTAAPSMDIQVSSNFERLLFELHGRDGGATAAAMREFEASKRMTISPNLLAGASLFESARIGEDGMAMALRWACQDCGEVIDPHTAIGLMAARRADLPPDVPIVTLATAHPAKFRDAVERATGMRPPLPSRAAGLLDRAERYDTLPGDLASVEAYVAERAVGAVSAELTVLPNGLRIVTTAMPGLETVAVGLHCESGSRFEAAAENGVAHMVEHMVFKGTASRSARQIAEAIEDVGGALNAYTSRDGTTFHARLLAGDLPLGIELIADLIRAPNFDAAELEREKGVVLSELGEARDTPDDIVFDNLQMAAFPGQPLGRSILGDEASIAGLTTQALRRWIETQYRPGSLILSVAGKVHHDAVVRIADRLFGDLAPGRRPRAAAASFAGGLDLDSRRFEQAHLTLAFEGVAARDPDQLPLRLFSEALGGGMSSRLFQELREERGLAYSIYSSETHYDDTGLFTVYLATARRDAARALALVDRVMAETAETLDRREVDRARAQAKAGMLMSLESAQGQADFWARGLAIYDRLVPPAELIAQLDAIGVDRVRAAGARVLAGPRAAAQIGAPKLKAA